MVKKTKNPKTGEPVEYSIGWTPFLNCKIDLRYKPMIPRKETEFWVKKAIRQIKSQKPALPAGRSKIKNLNIIDVFAGSGCIGIAVLKACPELCRGVDFAEINPKFIKQIKLNLKLNKINPRKYRVIQSDIFRSFKDRRLKWDYIFANPPYIALKNKHLIQKSVYNFEPHSALFGGKDGLFYIRKFLKQARKYLKPNGQIWMEFDHLQKTELGKLLIKLNYKSFRIFKDQYKKWRFVLLTGKKSRNTIKRDNY